MRILITALIALLIAMPAFAEKKFYKWQDANGAWHYTEEKPKDQTVEQVKVRASGSQQWQDESLDQSDATADTTESETPDLSNDPAAQKILAGRAEACERARQAVKIYEENTRVTLDTDNDGKPEELNTQQHLAQLNTAREQVKTYCE